MKTKAIHSVFSSGYAAMAEDDYDEADVCRACNSPVSPTDLRYARSHAELAGRQDPPLTQGLSLKEPLNLADYENWE